MTATLSADAAEEIRQAALRYCRGVDRLDADLMFSAYHPDATDDHGTYVGPARGLCDRVVVTHRRFDATMHCVLNHAIEGVDDTHATGELYNVAYFKRGDTMDTWYGRYVDRYELRDGRWAIAHRVCVHEWTTSAPIAAAMPVDAARFRQGSEDRNTATAG